MIYYDYTNEEIVNSVKEYLECIVGISYDELLQISKDIKNIYFSIISSYDDKIYMDRYKSIYYNLSKCECISELFIRKISDIDFVSDSVEKGTSDFDSMVFCKCLSYLINWHLIDLKLFWYLEFQINNYKFVTDLDQFVYEYYRLFTYIFFSVTNNKFDIDNNSFIYNSKIKFILHGLKLNKS